MLKYPALVDVECCFTSRCWNYSTKTDEHSNYPLIHLKAVRGAKNTNYFQKSLDEWKEGFALHCDHKKTSI